MPDEIAAIVEGLHSHALRQDRLVQGPDFLMHPMEHDRRVLSPAHENEPFHDFLLLVPTHRPAPWRVSERELGHVSQADRSTIAALQYDASNILCRFDVAD